MQLNQRKNTHSSPKVLGLIFLKIEDTWGRHTPFFFIQNKHHWPIHRLLRSHTVSEKLPKNSSFWTFFNSLVTSWISATSTKWSPFTFIFNLENSKESGGDKSGEYEGWKRVVTFFWVKNWQTLAALWAGALSCNKKKSQEQNAAGRTHWMHFRRQSITPL